MLWAIGTDDIVPTDGAPCKLNSVESNDAFCFKEHVESGVLRLNLITGAVATTSTAGAATTTSMVSSASTPVLRSLSAALLWFVARALFV